MAETGRRPRRRVGEIERSVRRQLKSVDSSGMRLTLKPMAVLLARAIDLYTAQLGAVDEDGKTAAISPAQLSVITKAHSELRATMRELLEVGGDVGAGDGSEQSSLPAPVWNPAQS